MLSIQKFENEVDRGLPASIYFFYSVEPFLLSEIIRIIKERISQISIETFESPEDIKNETLVKETSLFSQKRILIVHNFEKFKKSEKKIDWLKKITGAISSSVTLIILCNCSGKDINDEISFLKKTKNALIFNLELYERDLPAWVSYKASKHGIGFQREAVFYLIEVTGGQPGLISSEIEKISILLRKRDIDILELREILSETGEYKAFDLIEAVRKKDRIKTFKILQNIQQSDYDMILGALNWHFSNREEGDLKIYSQLFKTNLAIRQGHLCSLEMLIYKLLKD